MSADSDIEQSPARPAVDGSASGVSSDQTHPDARRAGLGSPFRSGRPRTNWLLVMILVVFAASSLIWDWVYRRDQPYDIDESGYLVFSLLDFRALGDGGLWGWLTQVESPNPFSPLTTAASTPVYLILGPHPVAGLLVPLFFSLVAIAATYGVARRIAGTSVAVIAASLTASAPVIVNYSRDYHFAAAATAMTTLALYCLLRTDRFDSMRWSLLFGATIGMMPLARTMTVAFIPGFAAAAAIYVIASEFAWRRLRNLLWAAGMAIAVAASWLAVNGNGKLVWEYLTDYGYGSISSQYGQERGGVLSYHSWIRTLQVFAHYILLPHLLLIVAGFVAATAIVVWRLVTERDPRKIARHPLLAPAVVAGCGFTALASSTNDGSAFAAPLVPAMCIVAAWAVHVVCRRRRWIAAAVIAPAVSLSAAPALVWPMTGTWEVTVPGLGPVAVSSGQSVLHRYMQDGDRMTPSRVRDSFERGREWVAINHRIAERLDTRYADPVLSVLGFRHRLVNINSINLAQMDAQGSPLWLGWVPRERLDDTVEEYRSWLRDGSAARACILLTASGTVNEFFPEATDSLMSSAAAAEGFIRIDDMPLPDGRLLTFWERAQFCPPLAR